MEKFTDFYSYVNMKWFKTFTLPDDHVRYTSFDCVSNMVKHDVLNIVKNEMKNKSTLGKICSTIQQKPSSLSDFDQYFHIVDSIRTLNDFANVSGKLLLFGCSTFFSFGISRDYRDSSIHIPAFRQTNCTLPSTSYYDSHEQQYREFIYTFSKECKFEDQGIFELENKIRKITLSLEKKRNIKLNYNIVEWNDFVNLFECYDFNQYLDCHRFIVPFNPTRVLVDDIEYIKQLSKIIKSTNISVLKNYLKYKFILSFHDICLPKKINKIIFDFFSKALTGVIKEKSFDNKLIDFISSYMGDYLGQLYIDQYFSPNKKQYVELMIRLIKISAKNLISRCTWMSEETKTLTLEKIDFMNVKVGGPTIIRDYSSFHEFSETSPIEIFISMNIYYNKENFCKFGNPVDKLRWNMNSYDVNAYYSPLNNEIVIPAGILNDPFFSMDKSFYENLGSIGSVIAHEISHGFDDQGRMFDKHGNYNVWWSQIDIDNYKGRIKPIIDQYSSYNIWGNSVSGKITVGENIADYTGISILTNILESTNAKKRFYIMMYTSYAKLWRQKIRDREMTKRLKTDVHAPPRLRTNVILMNIPKFQEIFNIDKEHNMYIDEKKQFKLWN